MSEREYSESGQMLPTLPDSIESALGYLRAMTTPWSTSKQADDAEYALRVAILSALAPPAGAATGGEPVAWAVRGKDGKAYVFDNSWDALAMAPKWDSDHPDAAPHTAVPLYEAPPAQAAAVVTDAMVEAAHRYLDERVMGLLLAHTVRQALEAALGAGAIPPEAQRELDDFALYLRLKARFDKQRVSFAHPAKAAVLAAAEAWAQSYESGDDRRDTETAAHARLILRDAVRVLRTALGAGGEAAHG